MKLERAWLVAAALSMVGVQFAGCSDDPKPQQQTGSSSSSGAAGAGGDGGTAGVGSSSSSSGIPVECTAATDCKNNGPVDFCGEPACEGGKCIRKGLQTPGTPLPSQLYGDCIERQCDITFNVGQVPSNDPYDDAKDCTTDVCTDTVLTHDPVAQGTLCITPTGSQGVCDGGGACVTCIDGVQGCAGNFVCQMNKCVGPKCANGSKDAGEGDVDCGGSCLPCADGKTCTVGTQCASGICGGGMCSIPACPDGVLNGKETGVDCGGPDCAACDADLPCTVSNDCKSSVCKGGYCVAPACNDAVQNGDEAGIDCGGSCATPCP